MKAELFPFQKMALFQLRRKTAEALGSYQRTHTPQVLSFTAPTGAGKTIILASLIESIYFGDEEYPDQPDAIFVWLSDSPELNEQSRSKIDLKADKIRLNQCVTITDESFDQEMLDDGHIYFLNTQKLGKSSNLTKKGDGRTFTIWETLQNTMDEKYDRLYFIIDEAHRGMQGRAAAQATTIMQKFLKGSREDRLAPVPVVLGVTATPERFNNLVSGTESTIQKVIVSADDVRASGLLKDRIIIAYPEDASGSKDMAVLQAAADDWKQKWEHWTQYCQEQHYAYVNPVFVIQVQNQTGSGISDTDLDDCLRKIEERTGFRFQDGEVVHTFGQTTSTIQINGVAVRYLEPSRIADDKNVKVVFFKENLSTGWDCPRAETMMSFRRATDATYIAQLLGRMVRTPMQMHIQVDDVLNDVHLYFRTLMLRLLRMLSRPFRAPREVRSPPMLSAIPSRTAPSKRGLSVRPDRLQLSDPQDQNHNFPARFLGETALHLRPATNLLRRSRRSRRPRKVAAPHSAHQRHLLPAPRMPFTRRVV